MLDIPNYSDSRPIAVHSPQKKEDAHLRCGNYNDVVVVFWYTVSVSDNRPIKSVTGDQCSFHMIVQDCSTFQSILQWKKLISIWKGNQKSTHKQTTYCDHHNTASSPPLPPSDFICALWYQENGGRKAWATVTPHLWRQNGPGINKRAQGRWKIRIHVILNVNHTLFILFHKDDNANTLAWDLVFNGLASEVGIESPDNPS